MAFGDGFKDFGKKLDIAKNNPPEATTPSDVESGAQTLSSEGTLKPEGTAFTRFASSIGGLTKPTEFDGASSTDTDTLADAATEPATIEDTTIDTSAIDGDAVTVGADDAPTDPFESDETKLIVGENGETEVPELDLSQAKDDAEKIALMSQHQARVQYIADVSTSMKKVSQEIADADAKGDGIANSMYKALYRDASQVLASSNVTITNEYMSQIADFNAQEAKFQAEQESIIGSEARAQERANKIQDMEVFFDIGAAILDPVEKAEWLTMGAEMFPELQFFKKMENDPEFKNYVINAGRPEFIRAQNQWVQEARDDVAQTNLDDPASVALNKQNYKVNILQAYGQTDMKYKLEDIIKNVNNQDGAALLGSEQAFFDIKDALARGEDVGLENYVDQFVDFMWNQDVKLLHAKEQESATIIEFQDYAVDSPAEQSVVDNINKMLSNGELPSGITLDFQGGRIALRLPDGTEVSDPILVPGLDTFFQDWSEEGAIGEMYTEEYTMDNNELRDPDFMALDKLWIDYNNALPAEEKGLTRSQFQKEYYDESKVEGTRVDGTSKSGKTPDKLASAPEDQFKTLEQSTQGFDESINQGALSLAKTKAFQSMGTGESFSDTSNFDYVSTIINDNFDAFAIEEMATDLTARRQMAQSLGQSGFKVMEAADFSIRAGTGLNAAGRKEILDGNGIEAGEWFIYKDNSGNYRMATFNNITRTKNDEFDQDAWNWFELVDSNGIKFDAAKSSMFDI